jgi:hypothetical protein
MRNLSGDSQSSGQDMNPDAPKYELVALTTWPQYSIRTKNRKNEVCEVKSNSYSRSHMHTYLDFYIK